MKRLLQLKKWIYKQLNAITPGAIATRGAARGLFTGTSIIFLIFAIHAIQTMGDTTLILLQLAILIGIVLSVYLGLWVLKKLTRIPKILQLALLITTPLLLLSLSEELVYWLWAVITLATAGAAIAVLTSKGFRQKTIIKKIITLLGGVLAITGCTLAILGLAPDGFDMKPIANAAALSSNNIAPIEAPSPSLNGNYKVQTLTYGSGTDKHRPEYGEDATMITNTIDGVPFLDDWEGMSGWYRERFWGFDARKLPVNGRVWYPEGEGPFPLALIVHGNHSMHDFSDKGYAYLGELMASRGFIFASVDQNFINSSWSDIPQGLDEENDARGWILLEHLKAWHEWNKDLESKFYKKVDTMQIALLGHSRGGEAVAHAALLNKLTHYPDDATIAMDYNYNINTIIAIAPVDGQYEPGNTRTSLKDINYFVMHGAQDGDVSSYAGSKQYERITFSDSTDYIKSGLYIHGANHGQFNTSWGANDAGLAVTQFLNNKQLLPKKDQEEIAKVYISAFLETTLKSRKEYLPLFIDARKGKEWLPETVYLNQYEDSSFEAIATYDEDFDVLTTVDTTTTITTQHLSVWREQEIALKWGEKGSRAAYVGWHYGDIEEGTTLPDSIVASYSFVFKKPLSTIDSSKVFTFSLAESTENTNPKSGGKWINDENNNSNNEPLPTNNIANNSEEPTEDSINDSEGTEFPEEPIDFTITIEDATGNTASMCLSDFSALQKEIGVRVWKSQFINEETLSENVFQTYYFPLADFQDRNKALDVKEIVTISFVFDKTSEGVVVLDNVGFMKRL
ncbi:alpha/beta hydrolase family protein [Dokdonia sp. Asnod1-B02]|uniref:alpha/beta hydrolase family protein n=1 Tax=Dokdonia sp. Asnod1-B02 TaxID=3160573 RepID=UPI0038659E1A